MTRLALLIADAADRADYAVLAVLLIIIILALWVADVDRRLRKLENQ